MDFYLDKVSVEKKDVLFRLLEYSLFEESENDLNEMNEDGIYEYEYFDLYFTEKDRDAYFIREKETGKLLGFVMIHTHLQKHQDGHNIAEYMVLPKYRRKQIGKRVAFACFDRYKGNWEVKPSLNSQKAYLFWKNTIESYTDNQYRFEDGIFLFQNQN